MDTDQAAAFNRQGWDSIRKQRDAGLIQKHHDVATDILSGKSCLSPSGGSSLATSPENDCSILAELTGSSCDG